MPVFWGSLAVPPQTFDLPLAFDLGATFTFGLAGALAAVKRGYDIVGVFALAFVSSLGGVLIRDGIFLQQGLTPLLTNPHYIEAIGAATLLGAFGGRLVRRFDRLVAIVDALGLGAYAAFGVQKSLLNGLAVPAAILVGVINASGGGILRDVITREEPLVFKPGQFYLLTALAGAVTFVFARVYLELSANHSALLAVTLTFVFRALTITFNWRTAPVASGTLFHSDDRTGPPAPPPPAK